MAVIEQLSKLDGLDIELCGSFIWVGGNTFEHRDAIRAIVPQDYFHPAIWHHKKRLWYFSPLGYRKRSAQELDMDRIRDVFGSQRYQGDAANAPKNLQSA
jgi:hypothetical protein